MKIRDVAILLLQSKDLDADFTTALPKIFGGDVPRGKKLIAVTERDEPKEKEGQKKKSKGFGVFPRSESKLKEMRKYFNGYKKMEKNGCCSWTGPRCGMGPGFTFMGMNTTARRAAYALFRGPLRPGEIVKPICENRECVNPDHITKADNIRAEKIRRGEIPSAANSQPAS